VNVKRWNEPPQSVIVQANDEDRMDFIRGARQSRARTFDIDLAGLRDDLELEQLLITTFRFPHPTKGLDAAIDLMSDLEWLPSKEGYLVVFRGLDHCAVQVADTLASILPPIVERFRTGQCVFVAVLITKSSRNTVRAALERANGRLDEFASLPWTVNATGSVPVIYDL